MHKGRVEAFSDGVIAIIMTIMVLELKTPHGKELKDLVPMVPFFFSYLQSFLFVGVYWNNHHHLFHSFRHINRGILLANLLLLFCLSLVPFATGWVSETNFAAVPVACYAGLLICCAVSWTILSKQIEKKNEWTAGMKKAMKFQSRKGLLSLCTYIAAIPVAFLNPVISEVMVCLVAIMWLVPDKRVERENAEMQENGYE